MSSLQSDIKKKVMGYLFFSPWLLVPLVSGLTALILTWANDGPAWLGLTGFFGVISSIGIGFTRFLVGLDSLYQKAWLEINEAKSKEQEKALLNLHDQLAKERDKRVTSALEELVSVFEAFQKKVANATYSVPAKSEITERVKSLFEACLKKLREQHEMWVEAKASSAKQKESIKNKREEAIGEIQASIESMSGSINGCMEMAESSHGDLSSIRRDLETSMRVAKRTDERMVEMGLKERIAE